MSSESLDKSCECRDVGLTRNLTSFATWHCLEHMQESVIIDAVYRRAKDKLQYSHQPRIM